MRYDLGALWIMWITLGEIVDNFVLWGGGQD